MLPNGYSFLDSSLAVDQQKREFARSQISNCCNKGLESSLPAATWNSAREFAFQVRMSVEEFAESLSAKAPIQSRFARAALNVYLYHRLPPICPMLQSWPSR